MTTSRSDISRRHHPASRKDTSMQHIELRLAEIQARHARERSLRDAERVARAARQARANGRSIRSRLGESIIRLGHRVAGESLGSPALTG